MNFLDILQKLLPFTYSLNNETFFGISGMEGSDWIITIAFILLVGIFVSQIIVLWGLAGKKDKDRLDNLLEIIENSDKSNIDNKLKDLDDKKVKLAWDNFKKGLIGKNNETRRVYDADYFFNKSSLVDKIGSNSFANIPSLLLSLGLLGTFIGLFYGLVQLNLDDAETLKESMRTLIHASGAKFASSIWGLGLSVAFAGIARRHEKYLEHNIHLIQSKINEIYPLQLSEQSLVDSEENDKTVIELLSTYLPYLESLNKLSRLDEIETLTTEVRDIKEVLIIQRNAIQGLALDIAENLQESFANSLLDAMSAALKKLESNIGGTPEDTLHYRVTQMSGGIGEEFTVQLQEIMNSINREIGDKIGQDADNLKQAIADLNTTLDSFKTNLNEQNTQVSSLLSNLEDRIQAQSENATYTTQAIADNATKAGTQITTALSPITASIDNISDSINNISTLNQHLTDLIGNISNFNQSTKHLEATAINTNQASDKLYSNVEGIDKYQQSLSVAMNELSVGLNNTTKNLSEVPNQLSNIVDESNSITSNTKDTYKTLANSHQDLINTNADSVANLENNLIEYQDLTNSNVEKVIGRIEESLISHQSATNQALQKALDKYAESINSYQEQANNNIRKTLATFDGSLARFAEDLSSALGELNDAIDGLNERLNRVNRR